MDSSSPPIPPRRSRSRTMQQLPSPLNPTNHPYPVHNARRAPVPGSPYSRKPSPAMSPPRFSPRSPLSFLSNSPTSTISLHSSASSSTGPQPRTRVSSATLSLDFPSLNDLSPAALVNHSKSDSSPAPHHIKIPSSNSSSVGYPPSSSSSDKSHMPSPLDKLGHLYSIPPSPPVLDPAHLLGLPPNTNPDTNIQHSIASPFVNLHSSSTPMDHPSPRLSQRRRDACPRSGSCLARELDRLDIDRDDAAGYDADAHDDDPISRVPSPAARPHN